MRKPLFQDIWPLKNERITRSRLKHLKQVKRVLNINQPKEKFEHFCSNPISFRIQVCDQSDHVKMTDINCSKRFLEKRSIVMGNLQPTVTLLSKIDRHSDQTHSKAQCDQSNNNYIDTKSNIDIIDITEETNGELICVDADDDDVVIVPDKPNFSTFIISKNSTISKEQTEYIPLDTNDEAKRLKKENVNNEEINCDNSVIEILDTTDDIIFVGEKNLDKTSIKSPENILHRIDKKNACKDRNNTLKLTSKKKNNMKRKLRKLKKKFSAAPLQTLTTDTLQKVLSKELNMVNLGPTTVKSNCQSKIDNCSTPLVHKIVKRLHTEQNTPKLSLSFNDFQNNMCNVQRFNRTGLREIIIDGSNVAMGHSNGRFFSVKGLQIAVEYFLKKGHKVTAFVPQYRQKYNQTSDCKLLTKLADKGYVVFTPSREVNGRRITPYDDRYIIQYAAACEGIVVSNDNYRDLFLEKPEWRQTIEKRLLMPTWIGDVLMFPEDPLGRHGPCLSSFLRFPG